MQFDTVLLMSGGAVQALQLFVALSVLIILHEFGHFFFAKLFKTKVEKFYLFFDFLFPFPNVLNFPLFKKTKGDTEYGVGWFPLGGYVKIAGMVDESMDKEAMARPPEPWEFRSKKAWQRLFIMLGGIIMNILTAMVIYAVVFGVWGEEYLPTENAKYGIAVDSLGESMGLQTGDKIVSVNGEKVERFNSIVAEVILSDAQTMQVNRGGRMVDIEIPDGTIQKVINSKRRDIIQPRIPIVISDVKKGSAAAEMGLKEGDSVIAVNDKPVYYFDEFNKERVASAGKPITVSAVRDNKIVTLSGEVPKSDLLGIAVSQDMSAYFETEAIKYGFFESIGKGFTYTFHQVGSYWRQLKLLFTSDEVKASESLGGLVSFGKLFAPVFDWQAFLILTAFVSIILAVMNLLPIPGLDGGYVLFLLFEMISGRKVSEKVMETATTVGLVLLLGLMLYANGLDIVRLFK